jgi:hypothetical protein
VRDLERFDGSVTPDELKQAGLIRSTRIDVKILGSGELKKKLTVSAHLFSKSAREKIESAGGSVTWLRGEPKAKPKKERKRPAPASEAPEAPEEPAEETQDEEPAAEAEEAEQPEEEG